ncbi:MAG: hypothetical protein GF365_02975 [Candidatus Buchananbacteria bacterium]|nr:hypothetical protein [Candidatus Buchananbacteria bacterium]
MVDGKPMSEKSLKLAYWYVTNKLLLKRILIIVLIIVNALLAIYLIYLLVFNLYIYRSEYQVMLNNIETINQDYPNLRVANLPQDIQVGQIKVLPNNENYDLMVEIANPNVQWWASFNYKFQVNDELTETRSSFILPGETKRLVDLSVPDGDLASRLDLSNVVWQKEIDYVSLQRLRLRFDIQNVEYVPASELGVGQELPVSRVLFTVYNNTAYNYKNIKLLILLKSADNIVAINQISSGALKNNQSKKLESTFFQSLPRITSVEVVPEVNILDDDVYLDF